MAARRQQRDPDPDEDEDEDENEDEDVNKWLTLEEFARATKIQVKRDARGELRIRPDDATKLKSGSFGLDAEVVRILSQSANVHLAANQRLTELIPKGMEQFLNQILKSNERLMTRVEKLEKERTDMLETIEKARTQQEERQLERLEVEKAEERKDTALAVLIEQGPKLIEQFLVGSDVQKLLATIDPSLLEALGEEGSPLSADQRLQVQSIAKRIEARRKPQLKAVPNPPEDSSAARGTASGES